MNHVHLPQVRAADALHMPVLVTEQYPERLGATVPEIADVIPESLLVGGKRYPKTMFSMMGMWACGWVCGYVGIWVCG